MATFTTKYDLGDKLYFLKNNKIQKGIVVSIYFDTTIHKNGSSYTTERYTLVSEGTTNHRNVSELFEAEDELIQSLKS